MGMKDHRLIERLREADPATPERLAAASYDAVEMRRRILSQGVDELAVRRRVRRHRVGVVAAAAFVTAALLVPLILLLPLGDDANRVGGGVSPTVLARFASSTSTRLPARFRDSERIGADVMSVTAEAPLGPLG
jgi:hypothetical protein